MPIQLDTSRWPLVTTTLSGVVSDADLEDYCARFEAEVLGRRTKFVSLVDTLQMSAAPTARQRRSLADWQGRTEEAGKRYNLGIGMVIGSALIRGAFTALNWLSPPAVKTEVFPTTRQASAFLLETLSAQGLAPPPEIKRVANGS